MWTIDHFSELGRIVNTTSTVSPRSEDGFRVPRVVRESVAQILEGLLVVPLLEVQQPHRRQKLGAFGRELKSLLRDRSKRVK